jgi:hypothetical protein
MLEVLVLIVRFPVLKHYEQITIFFSRPLVKTFVNVWMIISICRLLADKINKVERKNKSEIFMLVDRFESDDFWEHLGGKPKDSEIQVCWS